MTPERSEKYDFSKPYLESSWAVLVDGSKHKPKSFAELRGKPIAAQQSTTSESQLKSLNLTDKIVPVQTIYLGKAQMEQGNAVAVYDVESVLKTYVQPGGKYYLLPDDKSAKIQTAFAIVKGNTMLKTKIDRGLDKIHADGTYQKILQHWQQNNGSNTDLPAASAAETP
uniref:ABC transporter substrate-binding protein n=1 Tax=Conchiformibius kuhniae TaxID=211502 RepID=A0A8T9MX27_9NEIS|nr:ABC transporter substrate-binding protein [Conchiformibius kuhniae]